MRMWMINPKILCRQHLLGEHNEIHKFKHNFVKRHNMQKRIDLEQIEPQSMKERHDELAREMTIRFYSHNSPYEQPDVNYLNLKKIDRNVSLNILLERCSECRRRASFYKENEK